MGGCGKYDGTVTFLRGRHFPNFKGDKLMKALRASEVVVFATLAMLIPEPAFAYIDPGLGSLIFQGAIAAFVTIAAAWAGLKMKILAFFGKAPINRDSDENASG
jgi:hypothetical protein